MHYREVISVSTSNDALFGLKADLDIVELLFHGAR